MVKNIMYSEFTDTEGFIENVLKKFFKPFESVNSEYRNKSQNKAYYIIIAFFTATFLKRKSYVNIDKDINKLKHKKEK